MEATTAAADASGGDLRNIPPLSAPTPPPARGQTQPSAVTSSFLDQTASQQDTVPPQASQRAAPLRHVSQPLAAPAAEAPSVRTPPAVASYQAPGPQSSALSEEYAQPDLLGGEHHGFSLRTSIASQRICGLPSPHAAHLLMHCHTGST